MEIKDSGDRTPFESGAVRDLSDGKGRFDLLPMCVLMRLARHFENGAKKYGERNWEKGIPSHSYLDSAMRHIVKYADGWRDEDHLISAIWNLACLAWNEEKRPDLMDIPSRGLNGEGTDIPTEDSVIIPMGMYDEIVDLAQNVKDYDSKIFFPGFLMQYKTREDAIEALADYIIKMFL